MYHVPTKTELYHLLYVKHYVEAPGGWVKFIGQLKITSLDISHIWHLNTHNYFYHICTPEYDVCRNGFHLGLVSSKTNRCMICDSFMPKSAKTVLKLKALEK